MRDHTTHDRLSVASSYDYRKWSCDVAGLGRGAPDPSSTWAPGWVIDDKPKAARTSSVDRTDSTARPTDLLADKKRWRRAVAVGKCDVFVHETISVL